MSMSMIHSGWASCEYTQKAKNKAAKDSATTTNKELAVKLINQGVANNLVEMKTGLSQTTVTRYKTKIKQGLM
jgi:DNA-binding NarL/FixJ family response regulator